MPPLGRGTVRAGKPGAKPQGELWTRLERATTAKQLRRLELTAKRLGYAPEGQLRQAIATKTGRGIMSESERRASERRRRAEEG